MYLSFVQKVTIGVSSVSGVILGTGDRPVREGNSVTYSNHHSKQTVEALGKSSQEGTGQVTTACSQWWEGDV